MRTDAEIRLRKLLGEALDHLYDLRGEWEWKRNERAGNAEEYAALEHLIGEIEEMLREKRQ